MKPSFFKTITVEDLQDYGALEPQTLAECALEWQFAEYDPPRIYEAECGFLAIIHLKLFSKILIHARFCELQLPWEHPPIDWLTDAVGLSSEVHRFFFKSHDKRFRLLGQDPVRLRRPVDYVALLGYCQQPMPDLIQSELPLDTTLRLISVAGQTYNIPVSLRASLTAEVSVRKMCEREQGESKRFGRLARPSR